MTQGRIVRAWRQGGSAHLAVAAREAGDEADTEYIGSVPEDHLAGLTGAEIKARLVEAVKEARERSRRQAREITGLSGVVTL